MQQAVSIAQNLGYLTVNDTRVAGVVRMIPRAEYDELLNKKKTPGQRTGDRTAATLDRAPAGRRRSHADDVQLAAIRPAVCRRQRMSCMARPCPRLTRASCNSQGRLGSLRQQPRGAVSDCRRNHGLVRTRRAVSSDTLFCSRTFAAEAIFRPLSLRRTVSIRMAVRRSRRLCMRQLTIGAPTSSSWRYARRCVPARLAVRIGS
jgi:hypothetical protein